MFGRLNADFGSIEYLFPLLFHPDADLSALQDVGDIEDVEDTDNKEEEKEEEKEEDVTEEENKEEKEDKEEDDEEKKEDESKEEESVEEDDEELKLTTTVTDVKKYDPEFFKKFPDVKAAMFREQRYLETVGTLEQAVLASRKAETLDNIETDLLQKGDPTTLLDTLHENKEAFSKVVNKILPYLAEKDKDLYLEISAVPIKQLLRAAWKEGNGNATNLGKAAAYIHHFFFNGDTNIEAPLKNERIGKEEKSESEKRLEERLAQIEQREYTSFKSSVDNSYISKMTNEIRSTLDKDERLSDYTRSKLVEDILVDIREQLAQDERYLKQMNGLWLQAKKSGYTSDLKSRLISTALARAKSLVPEVRKRLIAKALGRAAKKETTDKDKTNTNGATSRKFSQRDTKSFGKREEPTKPKSDLDILREP